MPVPSPIIALETAKSVQQFEQILKLQKSNHRDSLSPAQQIAEGFVYAQYNLHTLQQLSEFEAQIIATDGKKVIGYNLAISTQLVSKLPDLKSMFYAFDQTTYQGRLLRTYSYVVGGQVCVDKGYRGQGLLRRMYNEMKTLGNGRYELCVTDVSQRNTRSLQAHLNIGFVVAGTYEHDGEIWHTVVWDWKKQR
ncbi:hypothetical protein [Mucilaginibacter sp. PAMB04168]|uniref:GNAT family N-acetyltransferase n=1 Tax=Mucilaginibacter sp. PAMB04168 TaxID=3138567 RepID=UPI0031F6A72A